MDEKRLDTIKLLCKYRIDIGLDYGDSPMTPVETLELIARIHMLENEHNGKLRKENEYEIESLGKEIEELIKDHQRKNDTVTKYIRETIRLGKALKRIRDDKFYGDHEASFYKKIAREALEGLK